MARATKTVKKSTAVSAPRRSAVAPVVPNIIDDSAYYDITMRVPHMRGRQRFSPLNKYRVKGWVLKELPAHKVATCVAG